MRVRNAGQGRVRAVRSILLLLATVAASGCGVGYNRTLFFTSANIGLNIDSAPPTAELNISRREGVIGPSLEGGIKLPVLASFLSRFTGILGVLADVSSTFAGGDAAETLADLYDRKGDQPNQATDSTRCVSTPPEATTLLFNYDVSLPGPGKVKPFVFGTDTSLGLKVRWSGATAQYPDSVKFGYNRKELALASVFVRPASSVSGTITATEIAPDKTGVVTFNNRWIYAVTPRTVVLRGGSPVDPRILASGDLVDIYSTYLVVKKDGVYIPAPVSPGLRNSPCSWGEWEVHMPSFLATVDHTTKIGTPTGDGTGSDHMQLFATGAAATSLARQEAVRIAMLRRIDPKAAAVTEELKAFTGNQTKQIAAFQEIRKLFEDGQPDVKDKIVSKAKGLVLVPATTTQTTFVGDLSDAVKGRDPEKTKALESLREFAKNPQ